MPTSRRTQRLELFNKGQPLRVVRVDDARLGVIDEVQGKVWVEHDLAPTLPVRADMERLTLGSIPPWYGCWKRTTIGGISRTLRREGILRAHPGQRRNPVVLFATHAPRPDAVATALEKLPLLASLGDSEWGGEGIQYVTEVIVHDPDDVAQVAAHLARAHLVVHWEDVTRDAHRPIGIERLDRIAARVVRNEQQTDEVHQYGLKRGKDNWKFPWLPSHWRHLPITWDHMVENVIDQVDAETLTLLSQPLRQHVAATLLDERGPPKHTVWRTTTQPWGSSRLVHDPALLPPWLLDRLTEANDDDTVTLDEADAAQLVGIPATMVVNVGDRWWRSCAADGERLLKAHIPTRRYVSAKLTDAQTKQLIDAFYLLMVEQVDPGSEHGRALTLVLFQYMKERGYTARWLGKYVQEGHHVGNGDTFRKFRRLCQYAPHRLPVGVLNKLVRDDGRLHSRGSKGSRSKYADDSRKRYRPRRRLERTLDDERAMAHPHP